MWIKCELLKYLLHHLLVAWLYQDNWTPSLRILEMEGEGSGASPLHLELLQKSIVISGNISLGTKALAPVLSHTRIAEESLRISSSFLQL